MKARFFVEVQINDAALLKMFGEKLAQITSSGAIEAKIATEVGKTVAGLPNMDDVQVSVIPVALRSDRL